MTTTELSSEAMGSALAMLWQRHRESNLARIVEVEEAAARILRGSAEDDELAAATAAAHKLAGSLGTFGFDAGSRAALEAEAMLRDPGVDHRYLAEVIGRLRSSLEERPAAPATTTEEPTAVVEASAGSISVLSADSDLVSRLTTAGAAAGVTVAAITNSADATGSATVVIDAGQMDSATTAATLVGLSGQCPIVVLSDEGSFEARLQLTRSGASAVIPRSQSPHLTVNFLCENLIDPAAEVWRVMVLHRDPAFVDVLNGTLSDEQFAVHRFSDPHLLWKAANEDGADLLLIDGEFVSLPMADICQVLRSDPDLIQIPIIGFGPRRSELIQVAIRAGMDDYWSSAMPALEIRCRLRSVLQRSRHTRNQSGVDTLTGTKNRNNIDRSLDRCLREALERETSFTFARVKIAQLDELSQTQGQIVSDMILRRLAGELLDAFPDALVGRWAGDEFVVGMEGYSRDQASERIEAILERVGQERFGTVSGSSVQCALHLGLAVSPLDGSTLASLDRASQTDLDRSGPTQGGAIESRHQHDSRGTDVLDVVLVEDDDSVADVIEYALGLRGYRYHRFIDGAEAAASLTGRQVDGRVILLDVGLPSLDGFGVLQRLGEAGILDSRHLIMLTARSSESERLRALELGATEHITKPFSVQVLLRRLDQVLGTVES